MRSALTLAWMETMPVSKRPLKVPARKLVFVTSALLTDGCTFRR